MFAHWEEYVVDDFSNNFELRSCFLHHSTWVCKLNYRARPNQRLLRYLEKSLLHRLKCHNQKIYKSLVYWKGSCATENFQGIGTVKKALQHFWSFHLDTLKTTCWIENLAQRWIPSGPFFSKTRTLFPIFKTEHGGSPQCLNVFLSQKSYAWMLKLNDHYFILFQNFSCLIYLLKVCTSKENIFRCRYCWKFVLEISHWCIRL